MADQDDLVAMGIGVVIAGIEYGAALQTRMAERLAEMSTTQAEVEQGRQALLHNDLGEAQLHLSEAYRRGDHSSGTTFMLARALQPLRAEQARFTATTGHMWSAAFSPDGRQIVTTDDKAAQDWDARTNQLVFTLQHGSTVYGARYSTDGEQLIAELPSVTPVAGDFTSAFPAVSAAGDRAAIARGSTVEVYELPGSRLIRAILHGAAVHAVAFAPVGHDLISGAAGRSADLVPESGAAMCPAPAVITPLSRD